MRPNPTVHPPTPDGEVQSVSTEESSREGSTSENEKGAEKPEPQAPAWPEGVPLPARPRPSARLKFCDSFQARAKPSAGDGPDPRKQTDGSARSETATSDAESSEDFSDISDDSDLFHLTVDPAKNWTTEQDRDEEKICYIAKLLRRDPFVPPDPADAAAEEDWDGAQSGAALPRAHCAFRGCTWVTDVPVWEEALRRHVEERHTDAMNLEGRDARDAYDFYEAAIERQAQQRMPTVGVSIDRRSLRHVTDTFNDENVYSLV